MPELEPRLRALGASIDFPPTPDLVATVEPRLGTKPARRRGGVGRALAFAFALLLLAVGTAFAVPQSRDFILERLGLRGATVERVVSLPEVSTAVAGSLHLGERVTLAEARRRVDFDVLVPALLGSPDRVYVDTSPRGGRVSLVYGDSATGPAKGEAGVGLLMTEFRGDLAPEFLGKLVSQGGVVEEVSVAGGRGLWISGPPHVVFYRDADGEVQEETLRLAGNTLLWERGPLLLRLESRLPLERALVVARSF